MRNHRIPSRPHLQGNPAPLRLRHSARKLTDGAGLVLLRRLWDRWDLGAWLDERTEEVPGRYRPSLMVEIWTALLLYGGGWMDDLKLVAARGVRWRPGSAWSGAEATEWLPELVGRLRAAGVTEITVRLDKGFLAEDVVRCLQKLEVSYQLKIPNQRMVRDRLGPWRRSSRAEGIFEDATTVRTSTGRLWGGRLLSLKGRRPLAEAEGTLALDTHEVTETAHVLTDREGTHALTAWRAYNRGAAVEGRITELGQLSVGRTAVDDLDGNALLWTLGTLAYQKLHVIRSQALSGPWRTATPDRLRAWLFRLPGRFTRHARKTYLQLRPDEPLRGRLLQALRRLARLRNPPLVAAG